MHVAYISPESPIDPCGGGGIAAYLRAMVPVLLESGHRVTIIAGARDFSTRCAVEGSLRVVHTRLPSLHWYLARLPLCGRSVVLPLRQLEWSLWFYMVAGRVLREDRADVLESGEAGALALALRPQVPLVLRLHGSDHVFRKHTGQPLHLGARWNQRLEGAVWRRAESVTAPSHFQAREAAGAVGWARGRIHVVPNPLASEMLAEATREGEPAANDPSAPVVLYTGRLASVKGILPLLEATKEVLATFRQVRFVLAGSWQMMETPRQLGFGLDGSAANGSVRWLGHVSWRQLADWYRRATVFVMPSYYETFGISCLEAMAFGLPVVATAAGGLPEVVVDGVTGILVPAGDPAALAGAIVRLLRDPELRRRLGEAGRERVLAEFTAERVVKEMLPIYLQASHQRGEL